ncbi:MAG: hypothetical protein WKG00_40030 [Polyangiaceae bacterium]
MSDGVARSEDVAKSKDVAKSPGLGKSPRAKARSRAKWIVLGVLITAVFVAVKLGFVGYGWAHLMAKVFPRDESLLRWFPGDTPAVLIVDPHQIELGTLGSEQSVLRTGLERMRADIEKATDIDIASDVDKLAVAMSEGPSLVAARGRYDFEGMTVRLGALSYEQRQHAGKMYLARTGEDAITVIDGVLLYGDEAAVKAGIDASGSDASLADNDKVTDRLSEMGWDHAVLVGMQFSDKPSIRSMISGSNGPRAITVGMRTVAGLDAVAHVEAASGRRRGARQAARRAPRRRGQAPRRIDGRCGGRALGQAIKDATVEVDAKKGVVTVRTHLAAEAIDQSLGALATSGAASELYKSMRLFQLLAPSRAPAPAPPP